MCTLYYTHDQEEYRIGSFRSQEKARLFWEAVRPGLEQKLGKSIQPIYVETGKRRGK